MIKQVSHIERPINIPEFKARVENEALARTLFYEDIDAGRMPYLTREWTLAPIHVRQLYRSLALRIERVKIPPQRPSLLAKVATFCRYYVQRAQAS